MRSFRSDRSRCRTSCVPQSRGPGRQRSLLHPLPLCPATENDYQQTNMRAHTLVSKRTHQRATIRFRTKQARHVLSHCSKQAPSRLQSRRGTYSVTAPSRRGSHPVTTPLVIWIKSLLGGRGEEERESKKKRKRERGMGGRGRVDYKQYYLIGAEPCLERRRFA